MLYWRDFSHKFSFQVCDGAKDAASDDIDLDFCEPELDLVEPRRIGGSKVQMHVWMIFKELFDPLGFVGGKAIDNHVDFLRRD